MSITSAGGTTWTDDANDKLTAMLAELPEDGRAARETAIRRAAEAFARGQSRYQLGDVVSLESMLVGWIRTTPTAERDQLPELFAHHDLDWASFAEYSVPK